MQLLQFGDIFLALTAEAVLLERQVVELALVDEKSSGVEQRGPDGGVFVFDRCGEFDPAERVDARCQRGDAGGAPFGISDGLNQKPFGVASRVVTRFQAGDVLPINGDVVVGQQDGAPVRPVFTALSEDFALPSSVLGPVEC